MTNQLERFPTGVPGLDTVLNGGLIRGGIYLVTGSPGTGKTTLGNQIAYGHAVGGANIIFATVLTETHERMMAHLTGFDFMAPEVVGTNLHYVSIYDELSEGGFDSTMALLRRLVRQHQATLLVIDGAGLFRDFAPDTLAFRRFTHELCAQLSALQCTTILLSDLAANEVYFPIGTHVDGIIALKDDSIGLRLFRTLQVVKLRGTDYQRGTHYFAITPRGVVVYPRLESTLTFAAAERASVPPGVEAFGIKGLDDMLEGGVGRGSSTIVIGPPGSGKSLAGLSFIAEGAKLGQRGLICGFHETPEQMIRMGAGIQLPMRDYVDSGLIEFVWQPTTEFLVDSWAERVLAAVERGISRVFIDNLADIERMIDYPERVVPFLTALVDRLRERGVTPLFAKELPLLVGAELELPTQLLAPVSENVILLRYVELLSQLRRLISVLKTRESNHDTSIREFLITGQGIRVSATFESAEAVLSGIARVTPEARNIARRAVPRF